MKWKTRCVNTQPAAGSRRPYGTPSRRSPPPPTFQCSSGTTSPSRAGPNCVCICIARAMLAMLVMQWPGLQRWAVLLAGLVWVGALAWPRLASCGALPCETRMLIGDRDLLSANVPYRVQRHWITCSLCRYTDGALRHLGRTLTEQDWQWLLLSCVEMSCELDLVGPPKPARLQVGSYRLYHSTRSDWDTALVTKTCVRAYFAVSDQGHQFMCKLIYYI